MKTHVEYFDGYLALMIAVFAEKAGMRPDEYILSFFDGGCNAPSLKNTARPSFTHKVQCTCVSTMRTTSATPFAPKVSCVSVGAHERR